MRTAFAALLILFFFGSCCYGVKCNDDNYSWRFRLISQSGKDLAFTSSAVYDRKKFIFFSMRGSDTVHHNYSSGANYQQINSDSLLYVDFNRQKMDTVYLQLSQTDIDTLIMKYEVDNTKCCGDLINVRPVSYNKNTVENIYGGIGLLRKL